MERVSIVEGKRPIIFVAPHGADDTHTDIIADSAANNLDCYAVINRGWERTDSPDSLRDKADCNNIVHCHEDVIYDEFLDPLFRFRNRLMRKGHKTIYMFIIHGIGRQARQIAKNEDLAIILGYGAGNPASYTCPEWFRNLFAFNFQGFGEVYLGSSGGPYAGWWKNNLNQVFRGKWYMDPNVISMQLEFVQQLRHSKGAADMTGEMLAQAVHDTIEPERKSWTPPNDFTIRYY